MYVNTNVAALNAWQNLYNTTNNMNSVLQQLSSGLRINSAANDPAGLAISQQMQSQINGMKQASQNAQTGVSFLQTADGALSQIQNLLQSMYSLATEAANGTNVGVDRGSLQAEMNQYTKEINSITNQTSFNTKNLLDGVLGTVNLAIGANPNQELQFTLGAVDAVSLGVAGQQPTSAAFGSTTSAANYGLSGLSLYGASSTTNPYGSYGLTGTNYGVEITAASQATVGGDAISSSSTATLGPSSSTAATTEGKIGVSGVTYSGTSNQSLYLQVTGNGSGAITSVAYSTTGAAGSYTTVTANTAGNYTFGSTGVTIASTAITANSSTTAGAVDSYQLAFTPASATFQLVDGSGNAIGSTNTVLGQSNSNQNITVGNANDGEAVGVQYNASTLFTGGTATFSGGTMSGVPQNSTFSLTYSTNQSATGSGGTVQQKAVVNSGLSIMNYSNATSAQTAIQSALTQISGERAQVGSLINRLNQANSDLQTSNENLQAAQGGIMNADIALQMANLSKDQVLQQSGVAMLAQANQVPQALLKLLP